MGESELCATLACLPFLVVRDVVGALLRFRPRLLDDEITSTCSSSVKESSSSVAGGDKQCQLLTYPYLIKFTNIRIILRIFK